MQFEKCPRGCNVQSCDILFPSTDGLSTHQLIESHLIYGDRIELNISIIFNIMNWQNVFAAWLLHHYLAHRGEKIGLSFHFVTAVKPSEAEHHKAKLCVTHHIFENNYNSAAVVAGLLHISAVDYCIYAKCCSTSTYSIFNPGYV